MIERVALHQTRFRTPGVTPDARGIVLGDSGLVLFPSLDRLVAFLRAYGDESSLDELLPGLVIRRLITPLRTREIMLAFAAESSYRMDRVAGVAKLTGGLIFTGTSRHFVQYRDSLSPLGYDLQELVEEPADLVLYHDSFRQTYRFDREVSLRDLLFKLTPYRVPESRRATPVPARLWATSEVGVGGAILSYLFRRQVPARAALAEWAPQSAFDDRPRRLYLFDLSDVPKRVVALLAALPGVHVYEPLGKSLGVELGFRHPVALESCQSLFEDETLHLFAGDGEVVVVNPIPPFAPVTSLVRSAVAVDDTEPADVVRGAAAQEPAELALPLRLAPTSASWRSVTATVVPASQGAWLQRLLYALPPHTLDALRLAVGSDGYYLLDPRGIEGVPLGRFHSEVAPRIFVPAGLAIVPRVHPSVLEDLLTDRGDGYVFFDANQPMPRVVPASAFGPVSRRALQQLGAAPVSAHPLPSEEPELPLLRYDRPRRFPLWGIPGKQPSADESHDLEKS